MIRWTVDLDLSEDISYYEVSGIFNQRPLIFNTLRHNPSKLSLEFDYFQLLAVI